MFDLDEISKMSNTDALTIQSWINDGLFSPDLSTTDSIPFFSEESVKTIEKIQSLLQFGYEKEEVKKIITKVGLPESNFKLEKKRNEKRDLLTIGALAEKIDVSTRTIKHWEEKEIIEPDLRSKGGFRLYKNYYIFFCSLIKDLQLFNYSLDKIKTISDYFRYFVKIRENLSSMNPDDVEENLVKMEKEIETLYEKMDQLKSGIKRWDNLLKKQKKQITIIKEKNKKRIKKDNKK